MTPTPIATNPITNIHFDLSVDKRRFIVFGNSGEWAGYHFDGSLCIKYQTIQVTRFNPATNSQALKGRFCLRFSPWPSAYRVCLRQTSGCTSNYRDSWWEEWSWLIGKIKSLWLCKHLGHRFEDFFTLESDWITKDHLWQDSWLDFLMTWCSQADTQLFIC